MFLFVQIRLTLNFISFELMMSTRLGPLLLCLSPRRMWPDQWKGGLSPNRKLPLLFANAWKKKIWRFWRLKAWRNWGGLSRSSKKKAPRLYKIMVTAFENIVKENCLQEDRVPIQNSSGHKKSMHALILECVRGSSVLSWALNVNGRIKMIFCWTLQI